MPNGTVAPGKVCPSGPVPIIGSTILTGSGTCATDIEAKINAAKQNDFITKQYLKLFGRFHAACARNENLNQAPPNRSSRMTPVPTSQRQCKRIEQCEGNRTMIGRPEVIDFAATLNGPLFR